MFCFVDILKELLADEVLVVQNLTKNQRKSQVSWIEDDSFDLF